MSVTLHPLTRDNLPEVWELWTDFETIKHTNWALFSTQEECAQRIDKLLDRYRAGSGRVGPLVIRTPEDKFAGLIGIDKPEPFGGEHELWYALTRSKWHCGYGQQAVVELLGRTPPGTEMTRLRATTTESNLASRKILEKNGFFLEAILPTRFVKNGLDEPIYYYIKLLV